MKVGELLALLSKSDPELDVYVVNGDLAGKIRAKVRRLIIK